jgi:uncharacterized protein (DUF362 family)
MPPDRDVMAEVFLIRTGDRKKGIPLLCEAAGPRFTGKDVVVKANYNSADPFPASTHPDTLISLIREICGQNPHSVALLERSGMGNTRRVLDQSGVYDNLVPLGVDIVVLDDLSAKEWTHIQGEGMHWKNGFYVPNRLLRAGSVVQTCCLKTHRFGGHFTLSLKNSVGVVAKTVPDSTHNYMHELHSSPFQRLMIAEINQAYPVDLVILDALEGFARGGPEDGERVSPGLLLASHDRVAIDAVGVAILRSFGSTPEVMDGPIFNLEQIGRAAELGIGVSGPEAITLVPLSGGSKPDAERLAEIIEGGL